MSAGLFGKPKTMAPVYYNGNSYDVYNRSVWVWQGYLYSPDISASARYKRIPHKPLNSRS